MNLRCELFGHKVSRGYHGGNPYFKIWTITTDGINRDHAFLEDVCPRCNEKYTIGMVHVPQGTAKLWHDEYLRQFHERNERERREFEASQNTKA